MLLAESTRLLSLTSSELLPKTTKLGASTDPKIFHDTHEAVLFHIRAAITELIFISMN